MLHFEKCKLSISTFLMSSCARDCQIWLNFVGICYRAFLPREKESLFLPLAGLAPSQCLCSVHVSVLTSSFPWMDSAQMLLCRGYRSCLLPSPGSLCCHQSDANEPPFFLISVESPSQVWGKGGGRAINQTFCPSRFHLTICLQCFCQ